jgi:cytochrome c oxidase cbb3-type subunit 3
MKKKRLYSIAFAVAAVMVHPATALAAGPPKVSDLSNPLAQVLLVIILALLLAIALLANVVMGAAQVYLQRYKEEKQKKNTTTTLKAVMVALLCTIGLQAMAEDTQPATAVVAETISGLSKTSFYTLVSVILLELTIILALLYNLKVLLRTEKAVLVPEEAAAIAAKPTAWQNFWNKINSFKPIKEEADIDLGHDYDGIRELDNRLPPWWLYGFYICVIFAGVYLWRYHVSHSGPSSHEELAMELEKGAAEKAEYLKNAANNVDENTVKLLTAAADLDAGKAIFTSVCAACHGADGGGMVGPNLTDDYWLHGGGIKDVFKTIKYGVQEKGMKSWKDDYSPGQIAQLASYIKSLHGTKPAKLKDPQGELYTEGATNTTDSTATAATDSTQAK